MPDNPTCVRHARRVDVEALKEAHPIQDVVARYGVALRRQGRASVGRCPFHDDQGRPNFYTWPDTHSWFCFRCAVGGDAIRFVEMAEGVDFLEAVERLTGGARAGQLLPCGPHVNTASATSQAPVAFAGRDHDEVAVLRAATWLYHERLLADSTALAYLRRRGSTGPPPSPAASGTPRAISSSPHCAGSVYHLGQRCGSACSPAPVGSSWAAASWYPSCGRETRSG